MMTCVNRILASTLSLAVLAGCSAERQDPVAKAEQGMITYVTWDTMEADKLASVWLIKRHIEPEAQFIFTPKNAVITNGTPFDTPEAEYRRYHALSCFESILQKHAVTNRELVQLGQYIRDIEINYWAEKRFPESGRIQKAIQAMIEEYDEEPTACKDAAMPYFDDLFVTIRSNVTTSAKDR